MGDGARLTLATNLDGQPVMIDRPEGEVLFSNLPADGGLLPGNCSCAYLDQTRAAP
jgi:hypothetical protein